jgi:hypothetical protein
MSLYGPKIELPELPQLPEINFEVLKKPIIAIVIILILSVVVYGTITFLSGMGNPFSNPIGVAWNNNPLDLTKDGVYDAQLVLTLTNTTDSLTNITLDVTTNSTELIIFCPYQLFPNVSPGNSRKTTCIIRRDPKTAVFSGSYTINIKTNLGETNTTLNIISN